MSKSLEDTIDAKSLYVLWDDFCGGSYHTDTWRERNKSIARKGVLRKLNRLSNVQWRRLKRYRDVGGIKFGHFLDLCSAVDIQVLAIFPNSECVRLNDVNDPTVRNLYLCEYVNCILSVGGSVIANSVEIERFTEVD